MSAEKCLFLLDVDNIQGYIFDTNKMKAIIGASWLLDHINAADDGETFSLLKNCKFGSSADEIRDDQNFIYSSGGNTKVIFDTPDAAQGFEKAITKAYAQHGISVTTHIHKKVDDSDFIKKTLLPAEKTLAQKKYNKSSSTNLSSSPYFKICELCGRRYANGKAGDSIVCEICRVRYEKADKKPRLFPDYTFVSNIEEMEPRSGMIGVVVMDGNRMGEKIKGLSSIQDLKNFAVNFESIMKGAFDESLSDHLGVQRSAKHFTSIRPLIMGGDDICFIISADAALDFVNTFIKKVTDKSRTQTGLFGQDGIRFSAGVLFTKPNYPFNFAYRIAHSLLRSAKRFSRENGHCAAVDFHFLLSSSGDEIETTREREYSYDGHFLTAKPYKAEKLDDLKADAAELQILARNKVKALRRILRLGKHQSTVELLKYARRMDERERERYKNLLNKYGWKKSPKEPSWRTGLLDLAELTELVRR